MDIKRDKYLNDLINRMHNGMIKVASFNEMDYKIVSKLGKRMSAASWGIRFAASQKNVDIVLSGMNS